MPRKKSYQWQADRQDAENTAPSRSAKKRDSTALQELGEALTRLAPSARAGLHLTPDLVEALALYDRIHDKEGRRRQMQFIGRLMREVDAVRLRTELDAAVLGTVMDTARFHHAEELRKRLLEASDSAWETVVADAALPLDAELRGLILAARREDPHAPPHARRALFRALYKQPEAPQAPAPSGTAPEASGEEPTLTPEN